METQRSGCYLLGLGKHHIETLHFPIHLLILPFVTTHNVHFMQLTSNSIKCLVAMVILNEVERKGITLTNLLYALRINKTPTSVNALVCSFQTFYICSNAPTSKKYNMFVGKQSIDKDWEVARVLFFISCS